jgi:hypothetical protein
VKRVVSISIGSSRRDKVGELELLGERVRMERIGTDGDMERAARLFQELDGHVDAFGVGGADLGCWVDRRWYPLYSVRPMVRFIQQTPVVDGGGLKNTLERQLAPLLDARLGDQVTPRRCLVTSGADRWGMAMSFYHAGYECRFGDLMFALGLPVALHSEKALKRMAALLMPVVGRLPFHWLYPTGEKQEARTPRWAEHYAWAKVIAGDAHFIKRYAPDHLPGKILVTNTTTAEDVALFRSWGCSHLVTSTPVVDGRTFGTNLLEAALVAVAGQGRPLTMDELQAMLELLDLHPNLRSLNP